MSHLDPYYLVKDEIQESIVQLESNVNKWKQLPEVSIERASLIKKLISSCDTIKWQLDELTKAVLVAEGDMMKFGLNSMEIQTRRSWINSRFIEVSNHRKLLQRADDALRLPMPTPSTLGSQGDAMRGINKTRHSLENVHDEYIQGEQERQMRYLKEQDQDLDDLGESVQKMGNIGLAIHDELDNQDVLISDLGHDIDITISRLDYIQKKLEHLVKKAGAKGQFVMIFVLVILLVVLVLLTCYT